MDRQAVNSSNIASIGYDQKDRKLLVEFYSGKIYEYDDVDHEVFLAFMDADSKGRFFTANIRNSYHFRVSMDEPDTEMIDVP